MQTLLFSRGEIEVGLRPVGSFTALTADSEHGYIGFPSRLSEQRVAELHLFGARRRCKGKGGLAMGKEFGIGLMQILAIGLEQLFIDREPCGAQTFDNDTV